MEPSPPPAVEFHSVSKTFPGVRALEDVSFAVRPGEARALIGENGAGKSTLLKVLSGVHRPDAGSVILDGRERVFDSTAEALDAGVAVIHQELQLVPEMSVAENLYLGHLPARLGIVNRRHLHEATHRDLERLGEAIDPAVKVGRLPIAQRQMVEIAKALTRGARVLALDEPTSSLSAREVDRLFATVAELKRNGCAVLYVSHRMDELFRVCDSATVLRDGRHVETFLSLAGVSHDLLVNRMVGRDIEDVFDYRSSTQTETALEVVGMEGPGLSRPASFTVAQGEVIGLFGLIGAGRSENVKGLALAVSQIGMVGCTMLFCLASGDFDLSVGSVVACAGVVAAVVTNAMGSVLLGMLAGVLIGGAVGLCNGVVISRFRINALIATLATMQIVRGLGFIISGGRAVGVTDSGFFALGTSSFLGVPTPVWIALVCFVVFGLLLQRTTFGRNTLAIGGNKEAARLSGIPVARLKTIIFSIQGLMAGFAGVVLASRMTSGQPKPPEMFELQVISACVLGGVSLTGGVGSIGCVIAGVLIMGVVENALNLLNVPTFYQNVVRGFILLVAVMLDQLKNRAR